MTPGVGSPYLDELLAEVAAFEQAEEGLRGGVEAWGDGLAEAELAGADEGSELGQASGQRSRCSLTMKPSIFMRLTSRSWGAAMGMGAPL
jgi:hypothetical protein